MRADLSALRIAADRIVERRLRPIHKPYSRAGRPHGQTKPDRTAQMREMRASGKSLEEIGQHFELTRERVRQLIHSMPRPKKPAPWPRVYLYKKMKGWLWAAGYRRCSCGIWSEKVTKVTRLCPDCNRRMSRIAYHERGSAAVLREWQKRNPDKVRKASKRWRDKNSERVTARNKENGKKAYQRLRSTPEGREKLRAQWRAAYQRATERKGGLDGPTAICKQ